MNVNWLNISGAQPIPQLVAPVLSTQECSNSSEVHTTTDVSQLRDAQSEPTATSRRKLQLLPLELDLRTLDGARSALDTLLEVEGFLTRVIRELDAASVWPITALRSSFDLLGDKLVDRKRLLKCTDVHDYRIAGQAVAA